jgi:hypothetical protein
VTIYDQGGLRHAALIGVFRNDGLPLLVAAQLAQEIKNELGSRYSALPSNLFGFCEGRYFPWKRDEEKKYGSSIHNGGDFLLHHLLLTTDVYKRNTAIRGDFYFEIVNRQYVFMGVLGSPKLISPFDDNTADVESIYRIVGWDRGSDALGVTVRPMYDEFNEGWHERGTAAADHAKRIEQEFFAARANAVSHLTINISLAIRNAFDALHDYRIDRKSSFDWSATIKPPPGRYDGCDLKGYPLDPQHPWNCDLSPAKRKKRFAEIEAYINARDAKRAAEDAK